MNKPTLLTYDQVADRILEVLGQRPSPSTLRAAAAASRRPRVTARADRKITSGMPGPTAREGKTVLFAASAIEKWLKRHPLRVVARHQGAISKAERKPGDAALELAVKAARADGVSWQAVADAIAESRGTQYSKQAAQQRFSPPRV